MVWRRRQTVGYRILFAITIPATYFFCVSLTGPLSDSTTNVGYAADWRELNTKVNPVSAMKNRGGGGIVRGSGETVDLASLLREFVRKTRRPEEHPFFSSVDRLEPLSRFLLYFRSRSFLAFQGDVDCCRRASSSGQETAVTTARRRRSKNSRPTVLRGSKDRQDS